MFLSRSGHCVAVLGDVLYVIGGWDDSPTHKTAERYDPKTDEWSLIADMNVERLNASATALNGNINIMKQEGIHTKCINVEVMSVRQHANVLGVVATRSCKNASLSFAMFVCLFAFDNSKTVKHIFMKFHIAKSY
jgi:hypothetical protein